MNEREMNFPDDLANGLVEDDDEIVVEGIPVERDTAGEPDISLVNEPAAADTLAGDEDAEDATVLEGEIVSEDEVAEAFAAQDATEDGTEDATAEAAEAEAEEESVDENATTIARLEGELAAAQAEAAANLEQMKRVAAEFQNSKRRQEKQLSDAIDRAGTHIVEGLLPIVDGFDMAFQNVPDDLSEADDAWLEGFRQIHKKLLDLLQSQGVTAAPQTGEFDPNQHEAITSEPSEDVESGHIIETLRTGYVHKGRVLRPALVRVAQ